MAKVTLKDVSKVFPGGIQAVNNVELEVVDKEFLVLVGPSGCGKSTTLRMVAGLEEISEGEIYIGNTLVNDVPPKDRDIAMVFQNYALYPHMSVYNNMAFGLRLRKFAADEIKKRVTEAASMLGIEDLLQRKPKELSGGQRQRVAVGRAIVRKPKVFLFDEPLSNLDAKLRVQMRAELSKLHTRLESTMIYVTHDQVEAMTMGDRITVMKDGIIQQIANPITLYDYPRNHFVAGFIGTPPMNFIEGKIIKKDNKLFFDGGSFQIEAPDKKSSKLTSYENQNITFGIRPEDIHYIKQGASSNNVIKTRVDVIEPMGSETLLYLVAEPDHSFIAKVDAHIKPEPGTDINFEFDTAKSHFFDKETGKNIGLNN